VREARYRRLPARLMVIFVLSCWLFMRSGYGLVMSKLADAHAVQRRGWGNWDMPTTGSITKARARLGAAPLKLLFAPCPCRTGHRPRPVLPRPKVARLGRTLRSWHDELIAYFTTDRATSNGPTEAINLLIETSRRAGHGFRNFDNYRLRLLLAHGTTTCDHGAPRIRRLRPSFVA